MPTLGGDGELRAQAYIEVGCYTYGMLIQAEPPKNGTLINNLEIREIWVARNDEQIEYKPWLIYTILFNADAQRKISSFVNGELRRFPLESAVAKDRDRLRASIAQYTQLVATDPHLPPRLIWLTQEQLNSLPTELVNYPGYTFGDSIGGIGFGRERIYKPAVRELLDHTEEKVLFSPGILTRIPIDVDGTPHYIFQLAEKNLRTKGDLFYKPIGGHMKYTKELAHRLDEFGLELKYRNQPQDERDLAFYVPAGAFVRFRDVFFAQLEGGSDRWMFESPDDTLREELEEELGPIASSDGVPLLSRDDMSPYAYCIG